MSTGFDFDTLGGFASTVSIPHSEPCTMCAYSPLLPSLSLPVLCFLTGTFSPRLGFCDPSLWDFPLVFLLLRAAEFPWMTATTSSHDFNALAGLFPTQGTLHSRLNYPGWWTTHNKNTPFIFPRVPSQLHFPFQVFMFPLRLLSTISLSFSEGADLYLLAKKMLRYRFSQPHIPVPTNICI